MASDSFFPHHDYLPTLHQHVALSVEEDIGLQVAVQVLLSNLIVNPMALLILQVKGLGGHLQEGRGTDDVELTWLTNIIGKF